MPEKRKPGRRPPRIVPRTLGALIQEYRASPGFARLAPSTRKVYLLAFTRLNRLYTTPVEEIRRRHIIGARDTFADMPATANQIVVAFNVLMRHAVDMEYRENTPGKVPHLPTGTYRRWTDEELALAGKVLPEHFRRPVILALHTGQRQGDVLTMRWSDYDGEGIAVVQQKTGAKLWIACHAELQAELAKWQQDRTATTIITDRNGRPYGDTFATRFSAELRKHEGLAGLVFHGLRHTAASRLAEAGCTAHEIAAITGHKSLATLARYTAGAEQKSRSRAAVVKLQTQPTRKGSQTVVK